MKRIVIDGRPLCRNMAGTAMFQMMAIDNMISSWEDVELILVCPTMIPVNLRNKWKSKIILIEDTDSILSKYSFFVWYNIKMPIFIRKFKPDLFWTPSPSLPVFLSEDVKNMIIVHDLVNKQFYKTMSWKNRIQSMLIFDFSLKHADYIWTNSYYTKSELLRFYPQYKNKPIFTGLSVDNHVYHKIQVHDNMVKEMQDKYNIKNGRFLLFVGTIEPRKNLQFMLSLMPEIYKKSGMTLLVVGGYGWKYSRTLSELMSRKEIYESTSFAGYVSNEELAILYNMAYCFVSTSLNEGFGMPQLEAIFCGCPVFCPNNSAMKEVVTGLGITIDGWKPTEWINTILNNSKCELGDIIVPDRYKWENIIKSLYNFLQENQ